MDEESSRDGASLSEEAPCGGPQWGELLHWGLWKIYQERLWIQASLSIGAPLQMRGTWNLEGAYILGTLKDE